MFVFLSLHPVVCFSFEAQRVISVWIGEHINTFWIALSSPCDTPCAAAAVNLRWLTSSSHCTWLLRKTVTETDCVSPDTSLLWRTIRLRAQSHSLLYCEHKGCQRKWEIKQRVPGMIKPSAKTWCHSDRSLICRHIRKEGSSFQYLTPSLTADNDEWGSSSHKAALLSHGGRCRCCHGKGWMCVKTTVVCSAPLVPLILRASSLCLCTSSYVQTVFSLERKLIIRIQIMQEPMNPKTPLLKIFMHS